MRILLIVITAAFFSVAPQMTFAAQGDACNTPGSTSECTGGLICTTSYICDVNTANAGVNSGGGFNTGQIASYAQSIRAFINGVLVPLLMSVAFIVFLYGVFNYFILGASDETKRENGRTFVLYGVAGFVILISLWGIVWLVIGFFNLGGQNAPAPPQLGLSTRLIEVHSLAANRRLE